MKDALLIAVILGGAVILLSNRGNRAENNNIQGSGDSTVDRIENAFNSGFRLAKKGKSLWDDIF